MTTRCTAAQRRVFAKTFENGTHGARISGTEPALGTLDERLGIIVRRLGGRTRGLSSGENIDRYRTA